MGVITLTKRVKAATTTPLSEIATEVDAYGKALADAAATIAKIKELEASLKPLKAAEKALQDKIEDLGLDADVEGYMQRGAAFQVEIGPKGSKREVTDSRGVKKLLGDAVFFKIAKVNLKDLDDYMTLEERSEVIEVNRTKHAFKLTARP